MLSIEGVSILSFYPDWMHCKHLGIDKHLLGSCLYVLVHYILPGGTDANLAVVWRGAAPRESEAAARILA